MKRIGSTLFIYALACFPALAQLSGLAYELDTLFRGWREREHLSGELLVAHLDSVVYQRAEGYADAVGNIPLKAGMPFNLASVSKQFVAMAAMMLSEERRLDLDGDVRYYLPGFPYQGVSVRHLMTHTSGLAEYFELWEKYASKERPFTNADLLGLYRDKKPPLDFEPGSAYRYSNTGYIVLAEVVAAVSGMPATDFISSRIIRPLGLKATFPYHLAMPRFPYAERVLGFAWQEGKPVPADLFQVDGVFGDGNIYASAADLLRWSQALRRHELVSAATQAEAFKPFTLHNGEQSLYGFGWSLQGDGISVAHTGGWVGFRTFILRDVEAGYDAVFLSNSSSDNRAGRLQQLRAILDRYRSTCITDVQIADGSGGPLYTGALRLQGNRILEVGPSVKAKRGDRVVQGHGKVLAPGFMDTHSHHDRLMFEKRPMPEVVSQGITTIVVGQDGGSHYPLRDLWTALDTMPVAVNVASYVGHNTIRRKAMGNFTRQASDAEVEKMKAMLQQEMDAGAIGLSTGLEYDPGIYSSRDEVLQLARVLKANSGRYISHIRSEDRYLLEAVDELLKIGKKCRIPVQISHFKLAIVSQWGKADSLIQVLEKARKRGINVTADVYPYEFWQSTMLVLFPERDFTDREAARFALSELTTPQGMFIARYEPDPSVEGKTLAEVAAARGQAPEDLYLELVSKVLDEQADESVICTSMDTSDVGKLTAWTWSNICSDGTLSGTHPRGAGSFPKVLRLYQREKGLFSFPEAIRKMTALAAQNMGFTDRGMLRPGLLADLTLLDPEQVRDRATMQDPGALSEGILRVWVNGKEVWRDGKTTGNFPGSAIKRAPAAALR